MTHEKPHFSLEFVFWQDVDVTLSNILEGNIDYQPEAEPATAASSETQSPNISCLSRGQKSPAQVGFILILKVEIIVDYRTKLF